MPDTRSRDIKTELRATILWNGIDNLRSLTNAADLKAGMVLAWTSTLIGTAVKGSVEDYWILPFETVAGCLCALLILVAIVFLALGFVYAVLTFLPRFSPPDWGQADPGFLYWRSILAHKTHATFAAYMQHIESDELIAHLSEYTFNLSAVVDAKYRRVSAGIKWALAGSAASALMVIFC